MREKLRQKRADDEARARERRLEQRRAREQRQRERLDARREASRGARRPAEYRFAPRPRPVVSLPSGLASRRAQYSARERAVHRYARVRCGAGHLEYFGVLYARLQGPPWAHDDGFPLNTRGALFFAHLLTLAAVLAHGVAFYTTAATRGLGHGPGRVALALLLADAVLLLQWLKIDLFAGWAFSEARFAFARAPTCCYLLVTAQMHDFAAGLGFAAGAAIAASAIAAIVLLIWAIGLLRVRACR